MKRFFKILGIVLLSLLMLFVLAVSCAYMESKEYSKTAVPYIKEALLEISTWEPEILKGYMAQQVLEATSDEELEKFVRWFSKLGNLESIDEPQFNKVSSSVTTQHGSQKFVTYTIPAKYENGDAIITIRLLDLEGRFRIYEFRLNSDALID